jgi:predicted nucleic acid binding AN1-type Zn finger protein
MKVAKCTYCGDMQDMPFECNYCEDPFCAEHRLPEEHRCVRLSHLRVKRFGERRVIHDKSNAGFFKKMFGKFR